MEAVFHNKYRDLRIVGVRSKHMFARKIVLDFLSGRLVYPNEADASGNVMLDQVTLDPNGTSSSP